MSTVWYNYALATAGTISEDSDSEHPVKNTDEATESVCPKGWTLPNETQLAGQKDMTSFSPVFGGNYTNGALNNESRLGFWWGSEAYNGAARYGLGYDGNHLYYNYYYRDGLYVRCVQKSAPTP